MSANVLNSKDWAIFCRRQSDNRYVCVARFFNRVDAEDHLKFLLRYIPKGHFEVAFDQEPAEITPG